MDQKNMRNASILFMAATAVLWSTGGIFIKQIPWNPLAIAAPRSLIAAVIIMGFMKIKKYRFVINRNSLANGFSLGMVSITYLIANKMTTAANAIMLQYISPVFILIISVLFLHRKCRRIDLVTVAATLGGISLFFMDQISAGNMVGNLIAILGGLFWAVGFVLAGEADDDSRISGILLAQLFCGLVGLPVVVLTETPLSPVILFSAVWLGVFQMGAAFICFNLALKNCSALMSNLIGTLEPILNPFWVFLFHGEKPGFYALLGGGVVITVVTAWCIWGQRQSG